MVTRRTLLKGLLVTSATILLPPSLTDNAAVARRYWMLDRTMLPPSLDGWQFFRRGPEHLGMPAYEYLIRYVGGGVLREPAPDGAPDAFFPSFREIVDLRSFRDGPPTAEEWARAVVPDLIARYDLAPKQRLPPPLDVSTSPRLPFDVVF